MNEITITSDFKEGAKNRFVKFFRFDNSPYWKDYYAKKQKSNDVSREKLYARIIKKYTAKNSVVVDVGSGCGFLLKEMHNEGLDARGVDLFPEMIKAARDYLKDEKIIIHQADILNIPYEDNSIECISLESVIEHFPLKEVEEDILPYIASKIKDEGWLFVHVPVKTLHSRFARFYRKNVQRDLPSWAIDDDGDVTHKMWLTPEKYIQLIEKNGFELINYDFRTTRSNMKPQIFYNMMKTVQNLLSNSDEEFDTMINTESKVIRLKKILKCQFALTSYFLFKKVKTN